MRLGEKEMVLKNGAVRLLLLLALCGACSVKTEKKEAGSAANPSDEATKGTINSGPFHLHYSIEGTGSPAIVIGSAIYLPRAFSQNLRKHLRLVFLDHRGYAPSPGPMDEIRFAPDTLLRDIELARQNLGLDRIAIIGHSIHSLMALEYAKKYPDNVSHVIMIAPPVFYKTAVEAKEKYWQELASPERKAIMTENQQALPDEELAKLPRGERFIRGYIRDGPKTWYDPTFDASPIWAGVRANDDYPPKFLDVDITQALSTFNVPTFLALGRYDFRVAPPSTWDEIAEIFPDLTINLFEKSAHWPHYEEAALFDEKLLTWMEMHR